MNLKSLRRIVLIAFALASFPSFSSAQPGAFGGGFGPPLQVVAPPKAFATSDEHYKFLLSQAKGGTKHTLTSVPRWDGLWNTAGNTHMSMFIDPPGFTGKVKPGVLTPPPVPPIRRTAARCRRAYHRNAPSCRRPSDSTDG